MEKLKVMLRRHEGCSLMPYRCPAGKLTIGYGRNLDDNGITEYEAEVMLETDLRKCLDDVADITKRAVMDNRTRALVDMRYQMGHDGFLGFTKMIEAVLARDWNRAGDEVMDSLYAKQVPVRASTIAEMIRNG